MHKRTVVAGSVAVATAGSAILGGVALAGGGHCCGHQKKVSYTSNHAVGGHGSGGKAVNNCLNVGVPILSGIGIAGQGKASGASCSATANGTGGSAHAGNY